MLKFLKKKNKDGDEAGPSKNQSKKNDKPSSQGPEETNQGKSGKKILKWFSIKRAIFILLILAAVGGSAFAVYLFHFKSKSSNPSKLEYTKTGLKNIVLPEEMVRFCFDHMPDLYSAILLYEAQVAIMDREISRIDEIAKKYPEQVKIAEKEKAIWEKAKINLQKSFLKIEKPVKEIYVLFRVNKEQAMVQISEKNKELTDIANTALAPAQELTKQSLQEETPPQGFIQGNWYKLKKKFL